MGCAMTTRLISHYEQSFGVSEDDEARRLRGCYGWFRACQLAEVFEATVAPCYRAFWFRVGCLLAETDDMPIPPKEREDSVKAIKGPITLTVGGVEVTRADFYTWLNSKPLAKA
jgi:hypothetical protein